MKTINTTNKSKKDRAANAKTNETTATPKAIIDRMHAEHTKQASQPTDIQGEGSAGDAICELFKLVNALNLRTDVAAYCLVYVARILVPEEPETMQRILTETEEDTATLRQQLIQRHELQRRIISESLPKDRVRIPSYMSKNELSDDSAYIFQKVAETIVSNHDDVVGLMKELYEVFADRGTSRIVAAYTMFLAGRMLLRRNPLMEGATLYAAQCAAGEAVLVSSSTDDDAPVVKKEDAN